jgi:hypothetical protein
VRWEHERRGTDDGGSGAIDDGVRRPRSLYTLLCRYEKSLFSWRKFGIGHDGTSIRAIGYEIRW